ncbi:DUF4307 domain-containing protein [Arthrobacter sp. ISL-48]|uniref:DUF4307 domain-containing protein n=1 Tax=Arthrobacter sp. ISL-48 TaxID=2819110 RepID=UPI001BE71412|nr:DUF4307 domain-containing protein [Arthrobacter sp. ISL-48]MBT2530826.1 DUF4307 domain-containing protein [Arthrobacter sp. ISL-48]
MTSQDQPAVSPPASTSLANRYGGQKRRLSGKAKRAIGIGALAAGIGFMAWVSTSSATGGVTSKDIGFSVTDATQTEVDFQVTRDPGVAVKCAVKALDSKFAIVGWKVVDLPPEEADGTADNGRTISRRVVLQTESLAVSGLVDSCWIPDGSK